MIYRNNTRKALRTLWKLSLRLTILQLSATYRPSYITKVYRLRRINKSLLYGLYIIYYIKRTKQNRLKRKSQTRLKLLINSLLLPNLIELLALYLTYLTKFVLQTKEILELILRAKVYLAFKLRTIIPLQTKIRTKTLLLLKLQIYKLPK